MSTATLPVVHEDAALERRKLADELAAPALKSVKLSGMVAAGLFILLVVLAAFVPIEAGTLARAQLEVEGARKLVQHQQGGIVSAILVKEGDVVTEGQTVVRLNAVQAGAAAGVVGAQINSLRAEEAVRTAETIGQTTVTFPADLTARRTSDPQVDSLLTAEKAAFDARLAQARSQERQLSEQLTQIAQNIEQARTDKAAQEAQAKLLEEELQSLQPLLEKGLALKSRVMALQRQLEDTKGRVASLGAEDKRLASKAEETRSLRARVEVDRRAHAAEELRSVRTELSQALDKQVAADDTLDRTEVRAPTSGVVMALKVTTVGGVIEAGAPLMEIVPQSKLLVAHARVRPSDADDVRKGMTAVIRLDAAGHRALPRVTGVVQSISADALADQRTGEPYFEVRVAVPEEEMAKVSPELIAPGLPAEVLIKTGTHTMLQYLFSPVERAMFRSMRDI
jgi:HlyD family type I secretion membrane fusion protein